MDLYTHTLKIHRVLCIKISLHFYVVVNPNTSAATISVPCHGPLLYSKGLANSFHFQNYDMKNRNIFVTGRLPSIK